MGSVILATLPAGSSVHCGALDIKLTVRAAGVFFTTYESAKTLYAGSLPSGVPQPAIHAAASGTAELASCLVLTPAEVIKQNAQMLRSRGGGGSGSSSSRSTSLQAWRMLQHSEGGAARRLWSGYTALAARNLPHTAIQFPVFEFARRKIWDWRDRRRPRTAPGSSQLVGRDGRGRHEKGGGAEAKSGASGAVLRETGLVNGLSAGLSGAIAAVLTTPTDVVKTRMMLMGVSNNSGTVGGGYGEGKQPSAPTERRPGGWEVGKQVFRERGVKGLFRGGALRAVWTALASGLYLGTYEVSKVWLRGGEGERDDGL